MPIGNIVPDTDLGLSRAETAYRAICDAILSNRLRIGEPLREESIAQHLGMSRTPVREALSRLHSEGLVEPAKPRGYVVSAVTATQVFYVYAVREELEGFCLRLAARRIIDAQLFELSMIVERMERAVDDPELFSYLNRAFHEVIYDATGNPVLKKIMDDLVRVATRFPVSAYEVPGRSAEAAAEHRRMLEALTRHDPEAAEVAVREHLRIGQEARLVALRRHAVNSATVEHNGVAATAAVGVQ